MKDVNGLVAYENSLVVLAAARSKLQAAANLFFKKKITEVELKKYSSAADAAETAMNLAERNYRHPEAA